MRAAIGPQADVDRDRLVPLARDLEQVLHRQHESGGVAECSPALVRDRSGSNGTFSRTAAISACGQTPLLPAAMLATWVAWAAALHLRLRLDLAAGRPSRPRWRSPRSCLRCWNLRSEVKGLERHATARYRRPATVLPLVPNARKTGPAASAVRKSGCAKSKPPTSMIPTMTPSRPWRRRTLYAAVGWLVSSGPRSADRADVECGWSRPDGRRRRGGHRRGSGGRSPVRSPR